MSRDKRVEDVKELAINQTWVRFIDRDGQIQEGLVKHIDFVANLLLSVQFKGELKRTPVCYSPSELTIIPRPRYA